jgi:hypothetical protein
MNNDVNCAHHRIMSAFILQGDRAKEESIKNLKMYPFGKLQLSLAFQLRFDLLRTWHGIIMMG